MKKIYEKWEIRDGKVEKMEQWDKKGMKREGQNLFEKVEKSKKRFEEENSTKNAWKEGKHKMNEKKNRKTVQIQRVFE